MTPPLFKVSYGDEDYLFGDGDRRRFGRDDEACAIPIWEEIRRTAVSKVAGELWCMDNEMWLRNVSTAHELEVAGPDGPAAVPAGAPTRRAWRGPVDSGTDRQDLGAQHRNVVLDRRTTRARPSGRGGQSAIATAHPHDPAGTQFHRSYARWRRRCANRC